MRLLLGFLFAFAVAAAFGLGADAVRADARHRVRRDHDRRLDRMAEDRHRRHRPLCARRDRAQRRIADRLGRRRRVLRPHRRRRHARSTAAATCTLNGVTPPARFWTLTLYDPDGRLVANAVDRYGFTSQEIVRHADGSFEIAVAPRARAGNWLPTGGIDRYVLVLRLYDTPVGVATRTAQGSADARGHRGSLPMIRWLLWLLGGAAARRHRASVDACCCCRAPRRRTPIRASPPLRRSTASCRCPPPTPDDAVLPFMDPAFATAVCRYDLAAGPLKLRVPVSQAYTSVSFYTRNGVAYYAINDRAAGRRIIELDLMTRAAARRPARRRGSHRRRPPDRGVADARPG